MHLVLLPVGLPLLPLDLCPARGVEVLLDTRPVCVGTSVSSDPLGAGISRSLSFAAVACCLLCPVLVWLSLSSLHPLRGDELSLSSEALLPVAILPGFPSFDWRSKEGL